MEIIKSLLRIQPKSQELPPEITATASSDQGSSDIAILTTLTTSPHDFLQPSPALHAAALALAKQYLDPVAAAVSSQQAARLKAARSDRKSAHEVGQSRKRKRGNDAETAKNVLRLKSVALEGFDVQQIWEQARIIVDAVDGEVERVVEERGDGITNEDEIKEVESDEDRVDVESEEEAELEDADDQIMLDGDESMSEEDDAVSQDEEEDGESIEDITREDGILNESSDEDGEPEKILVQDKFGLNDGFFSIDDFNKYSEFLEQQDARGDPDDGAASDEEEVDWAADPLSAKPQSRKSKSAGEEDDEDDEDDGGPTFGDMDLDAPEGASDEEDEDHEDVDMDGMDDVLNANNINYADFFEPPAQKAGKKRPNKRGRPHPHNFPAKDANVSSAAREQSDDVDSDAEIKRTMSAVHRDLFSDEEDEEEDGPDVPKNASTHERRKATLLAQIRELEAENVAKRAWTLQGEARAQDRPVNALLEEDLDFERTGKPLPVVTKETSEEIEALIKRRILAGEFDEIRRRRPDDAFGSTAVSRRGKHDAEDLDAPRTQGLAEIYEEDHLRRTDAAFVERKDEKLAKQYAEIESLWKDVAGKLDSLASWRYRPKPVEVTVSVRTDVAAMSLEDARPTGAGGDVGSADLLAPQEIYAPGEAKGKSEIVTKGGAIVGREELTREEKKRRRRREKERAKKAGGQPRLAAGGGGAPVARRESKMSKEKKDMVASLKKGGVKVIGKEGLRDVEGQEVTESVALRGSGLKL
jgi:U3 small nucleolar RNA-associated protein MPP10